MISDDWAMLRLISPRLWNLTRRKLARSGVLGFITYVKPFGRKHASEADVGRCGPCSVQETILRHLAEHPYMKFRARADTHDLSPVALCCIIWLLEKNGLVVRHSISRRMGPPRDLYEVTKRGRERLGLRSGPAAEGGEFLRHFYREHVSRFLQEQGYRVKLNAYADGGGIDMVATRRSDGETIAVKIAILAHEEWPLLSHSVLNDHAASIRRVLCLIPNRKALRFVPLNTLASILLNHTSLFTVDLLCNYMEDT